MLAVPHGRHSFSTDCCSFTDFRGSRGGLVTAHARRRTILRTDVSFEAFSKCTLTGCGAGDRRIACPGPDEPAGHSTIAPGRGTEPRAACAGAGREGLLQGKPAHLARRYAPPDRQANAVPGRHG